MAPTWPILAQLGAVVGPSGKVEKPPPAPSGAVPMNGMQKAVVKNMEWSLAVPTYQVSRAITTDELDALYKQVKAKGVTITRTTRNKKKTITNVAGLEHYPDVKIPECAKTLGKKFACGASVTKGPTGKDEIDVQGDFSHEIADLLAEKFGVDKDTTKVVDKGRH